VSDPVPVRREFAADHGADAVIDPARDDVLEIAAGEARGGFDVVIEASGQEAAVVGGLQALRRGGRYVQIGTITRTLSLPANLIMVNELDVYGSFRYNHDFPAALNLLAAQRIPARDIVTETFDFSQTPAAFEATAAEGQIKVHVRVG
jgi:threonine dehydrogenase-like Zn-dependent dehydrogenase